MKKAIVVGTGAGGATIARELAGRFDVTVLEAGNEFRRFSRDLGSVERLRSSGLFLDARMIRLLFPAMRVTMTADHMALVSGVATGGTTTLATGNALRCDEALLRRGIDLGPEFESLMSELPVSLDHRRRWRRVTKELFAACEGLGLNPMITPKVVRYDRCTRCGRCVLGCPNDAKWDSREFLQEAEERGARLSTGAKVERIVVDGSRGGTGFANGVIVRRHGRRTFMSADLVILAAGGFGTPAVLARSGIRTEDRLFVDPVLCVAAPGEDSHQDEEVPMPFIVEGDGYIISPYFDYLSFFFNRAWKRPRHNVAALMIKLADTERGSVGRRGIDKALSERDRRRLAEATETCVEILRRCGGPRPTFLGSLNAGHPGGTLPLTGNERQPLHADHLPANVYVADGSLLPESLGKPPMLTIMALAKRIGSLCVERFA